MPELVDTPWRNSSYKAEQHSLAMLAQVGEVRGVEQDDAMRAARTCARYARDVGDLRQVLDMLGLRPMPNTKGC